MVNVPWCHKCDEPDGLCKCEAVKSEAKKPLATRLEEYRASMVARMSQVEHLVSHKAYQEAKNGVDLIAEAIRALDDQTPSAP